MAEQDTEKAQAADQNVETSGQSEEGTQAEVKGEAGDKPKPFSPEQEQYLGSWLGRIVANQINEKVLPHIAKQESAPVAQQPVEQDEALKKFNDKVSEKLFSGDAVGAMEMVLALKERARTNLTQMQNINLLKSITTYADQPYYEDVQQTMQQKAKELVASGYPPTAAAKTAYLEAKAEFLEKKIGGGRETKGIGLSQSGRSAGRSGKPVNLPPAFEKQCARDVADGIYKNREEWVKALSPKVRESLGI